jgi:hypothetical protein
MRACESCAGERAIFIPATLPRSRMRRTVRQQEGRGNVGTKDRDFMRESYGYVPPERAGRRIKKAAVIGIIVLVLAGAATWFFLT